METASESNNRIAKNTIVLYFRMIVLMLIGFFTTRISLEALGVENYGVYNVVCGLVGMFSLISGTLSAAISRFITFGLGTGDKIYLKKIFGASMNIQIILALIIAILLETVGLWFLDYKLVIPPDSMFAAQVVFQLSILNFIIGLLNLPYAAAIVAHEKMSAFAFMTLFDGVFKLIVVFSLLYIPGDKLIIYGLLLFIQALLSQLIYWVYCRRNFDECKYSLVKDKKLYKEIFGFSGWNFIGSSAALLGDQGVNLVLNMFFGPVVNAARGIAFQITGIIGRFSDNFMSALSPQITKNYASGNVERMRVLMIKGTKLSFFMFLALSMPVLFETRRILIIWLSQAPEYTVAFSRLAILIAWSNMLSSTLITALLATGKIRNYQICVGGLNMLVLPISYIVLKLGAVPYSVLIVSLIISQLALFLRLKFIKAMVNLSMSRFLKEVYFKVLVVILTSIPLPAAIYLIMPDTLMRFIIVVTISVIITSINIWFLGCDNSERIIVRDMFGNIKAKLCKK